MLDRKDPAISLTSGAPKVAWPSPQDAREISSIGDDDVVGIVPCERLTRKDRVILINPDTSAWVNIPADYSGAIARLKKRQRLRSFFAGMKTRFASLADCKEFLIMLFNKGLLQINGQRYFDARYYETYKSRRPRFLVLKVTDRCNIRCQYCYSQPKGMHPSLDIDLVCKLVTSLIEMSAGKPVTLCFHGGEPLLEQEKVKGLVSALRKRHPPEQLEFSMQSNGMLFTDRFLQFAKAYGMQIGISIDGPKDLNDRVRVDGSGRGSYGRILEGIKRAQDQGFSELSACAVVSAVNQDRLLDVALHLQGVGIKSLKFILFSCWGRGQQKPHLKPSPEKVLASFQEIIEAVVDGKIKELFVQSLAYYVTNLISFERPYMCMRSPCGAGSSGLAIDTNGDIYSCDAGIGCSDFKLGNAGTEDLVTMLDSQRNRVFRERTVETLSECGKCTFRRLCCGTCAALAYSENEAVHSKSAVECHLNSRFYEYLLWEIFDHPKLLDYFGRESRFSPFFENSGCL